MPRKTKEIKEENTIKKQSKKSANARPRETTNMSKTNTSTKAKTTSKKSTTSKSKTKPKKVTHQTEYYDLPYSYNKTIIKLLAQTPKILFVYWEVSNEDVTNLINQYGNDFFNDTIPVLSVYNESKNYYFDIIINDFANSWYIHVPDEDCKYSVKLKRVFKVKTAEKQCVEITHSNEIIIPNGHVLLESISNQHVEYVNLKTNTKYFRDVCYYKNSDFYKNYIKEFDLNTPLNNPSSNFNNI